MAGNDDAGRGDTAMVHGAVLSHRATRGGTADAVAFAAFHEAEDVLVECSDFELRLLTCHSRQRLLQARRVVGWGARAIAGPRLLLPATERRSGPPRDHVVMMAHSPWDLGLLERMRDVRRQATTVSVWLPEIWPSTMASRWMPYQPFKIVDQIFVGVPDVVDQCRSVAPNADVHVVPAAVDVVRFAPDDLDHVREIAALGIGRRERGQHDLLLDWARRTRSLYLYDTLVQMAVEWHEHRDGLANLYRHSKVSVCNHAKFDEPETIGSLRVIPQRLYEGLAAGAVLMGNGIDEARQSELVGQVVVEPLVDANGRLSELLDLPPDHETVRTMQRRNVALACAGHDWGHRWRAILDALDVALPERLACRLELLQRRAEALAPTPS